MNSIEKTVIIVSLIMMASAVGFVIYPSIDVSILESSTSEQIDSGMPSQYSKVVDIRVERTLEQQPDVSEEVEVRLNINTDRAVSRSEVIETFERNGNVVKEEELIRYTNGELNRSYLYPPRQTVDNSELPTIDTEKLDSFNKSEQFGTVRLSSQSTEFTGVLGIDFQQYTTSQSMNSVNYSVTYDSETGRLESYEVTATSDKEDIKIDSSYMYNEPLITSREPSVDGNLISYEAESEVVNMRSVTENKSTNVNSQNGKLELLKGEDIRSYVLFEIVNVSNNSGNTTRQHLITDEKIIISGT